MRKISEYLLWIFAFTVPWDFVSVPLVGGLTRLQGLLVVAAVVFTVLTEKRFRKPDAIFGLAAAFVAWSALSLLWTISPETTTVTVRMYAQMLGSMWVIREIARTREQQQRVVIALWLGSFVPLASLLANFIKGSQYAFTAKAQYSAIGLNADGVGLLLVLGSLFAWHVLLTQGRALRALSIFYLVLAPLGVLVTAVRGAFLAGVVAAAVIPLSLKPSMRTLVRGMVLLAAIVVTLAVLVPEAAWDRIATIPREISSGNMSMRRNLWTAGIQVFQERPTLGFGAGTFGLAIEPLRVVRLGPQVAAHSLPIGMLVEHGIVGLIAFSALFVVCLLSIKGLPPPDRAVWFVIMMVWLVGALSLSLERWKVSWLLFGLLAARSDLALLGARVQKVKRKDAARATRPLPAFAPSARATVQQRLENR